jgi:hypothetical protein
LIHRIAGPRNITPILGVQPETRQHLKRLAVSIWSVRHIGELTNGG